MLTSAAPQRRHGDRVRLDAVSAPSGPSRRDPPPPVALRLLRLAVHGTAVVALLVLALDFSMTVEWVVSVSLAVAVWAGALAVLPDDRGARADPLQALGVALYAGFMAAVAAGALIGGLTVVDRVQTTVEQPQQVEPQR